MRNLIDKIKRYFGFNKAEVQALLITILILGFVVGFDDGRQQFSTAAWFFNFFNSILIVALALLVQQSLLRIACLNSGYRPEYKMFFYGLLFCLVLSLVSRGKLIFLLPGFFVVRMLEGHRIGKFRYGIKQVTMGWISLLGPMSNMFLAIFFKALTYIPLLSTNTIIEKAITVNMLFAIYTMLPIPYSVGLYVFAWSRLGLAYTFSSFVGLSLMIYLKINLLVIILVAALIGGIGWLLFYIFFEQSAWEYV